MKGVHIVKNNTRKKSSFNFIDAILLVILIVIAAFLIYTFVSPYTGKIISPSQIKQIEYKILIEDVSDDIHYSIKKGDYITEINTLSEIGEVSSVEYADTVYKGTTAKGEELSSVYTDITITVKATVSVSDGVYKAGDVVIAAGKPISFRVPGFIADGQCISVAEVEEVE